VSTAIIISTAGGPYLGIHKNRRANAPLPNMLGEVRPLGLQGKGQIKAIIQDHKVATRLYAATLSEGVWRSDNAGASWREINTGILYRHGFSLVQHPTTGELYYGSEPASVFKSTDYGESWTLCQGLQKLRERVDWTFPNPPHVAHVRGLGLCASDPAVVFGAIEEGWVVRSLDGGETWQNIKTGTHFDAHYVTVMPDNPRVVFHTAGHGVYRSDDGGDSFADANTGLDHTYLVQLAVHPERPKVLFTAGAAVPPPGWRRPEGPGCGIYRSDDQGKRWTRLLGGLPDEIAKAAPRAVANDPADPDGIYVGLNDGTVWATGDGGERFAKAFEGLPTVLGLTVASAALAA
jgi:photosystem II stability/assembly factor-like uncharacterized protein